MPSGRPSHKPTDEQRQIVQLHAVLGNDHETIADIIGICRNTLYKHYEYELKYGAAKFIQEVLGVAARKALVDQDTSMLIFLLKTKGRFKETLDVSNDDGKLRPTIDVSKLTTEHLIALREAVIDEDKRD